MFVGAKLTKNIIITGGAGFIGSSLIRMLISLNDPKTYPLIINIDKLTYCGNLDNLSSINNSNQYVFIKEDIINKSSISKIFQQYQPRAIIHLAAESHVDNSINSPRAFIDTNIVGTFNLLEVSKIYYEQLSMTDKARFKFIHISTDEVYGSLNFTDNSCNEGSNYSPNSPYSASKASSDMLVRAWHHTYGLPTITTNCTNNYGPRQYSEKLIPVVINKAKSGDNIPIYGSGQNIRDWLYVDDHARALISVLEKGEVGQNYCISGNNEIDNLSLVKKICNILDRLIPKANGLSYCQQITFINDRLGHDLRYSLDASKIINHLGWKPQVLFEEGLVQTIKWYLSTK